MRANQLQPTRSKRKSEKDASFLHETHSDLCESLVVICWRKKKIETSPVHNKSQLLLQRVLCWHDMDDFSEWRILCQDLSAACLDRDPVGGVVEIPGCCCCVFFLIKKISSTSLVTLRCDDALRLVSSSLQEKKSFRTLLNRPLSGKALQLQKTNKREKNYDLARRCSRTRERAWWGGPLASLGMDGSVQNSALYPLGLKPFPGAKTLDPRDPCCQSDDALWAWLWPYMEHKGSDISGRWRCPSTAWVHIHTTSRQRDVLFYSPFFLKNMNELELIIEGGIKAYQIKS